VLLILLLSTLPVPVPFKILKGRSPLALSSSLIGSENLSVMKVPKMDMELVN
jgi:hypothetical protein